MAHDKGKTALDELISSMGTGFELVKRLAHAVEAAGGTEQDLRKLLNDNHNGSLSQQFGLLLANKIPVAVLDVREFVLDVDAGDGYIPRLIREANFRREKITVPIKGVEFRERGTGPARVRVAEFQISGDDPGTRRAQVEEQARKRHVKLASVGHLLSFAAKYRSLVQQVSLGYPHEDVYIDVYGYIGYDLTLRWESAHNWFTRSNHTFRCLVIAD